MGVNLEEHENQQEQSNSEDGQDEVLSLVKGHLENTLDVVSARDSPVLKGELQFLWKLGSHYVWNNFPQALQNSLKTYVTHLSPSDQAFYSHNDIQLLEDLTSL